MGISEDLALTDNDFTNAATSFWIAVVIAELPNSRHHPSPDAESTTDVHVQSTSCKECPLGNGLLSACLAGL